MFADGVQKYAPMPAAASMHSACPPSPKSSVYGLAPDSPGHYADDSEDDVISVATPPADQVTPDPVAVAAHDEDMLDLDSPLHVPDTIVPKVAPLQPADVYDVDDGFFLFGDALRDALDMPVPVDERAEVVRS